MKCNEIDFGSYECSYSITLPYKVKYIWEDESKKRDICVCIDKCLIHELINLWEMGIKTTGCCCGHGNKKLAYIGVCNEFIPKMKELGYKVYFNEYRPDDEDSFIPKTILNYGESKSFKKETN